jgi:hypothetical protein
MQSSVSSVHEYLASLPDDRKKLVAGLRKVILDNLPDGFTEQMAYGMIGYVIPHSLYPAGYHVDPAQPLPFLSLASQKNYIALYHLGLYSDKNLLSWFKSAYPKHAKTKLDMGKSCIRFKNPEDIPFKLIGELISRMTVEDFIIQYEKTKK